MTKVFLRGKLIPYLGPDRDFKKLNVDTKMWKVLHIFYLCWSLNKFKGVFTQNIFVFTFIWFINIQLIFDLKFVLNLLLKQFLIWKQIFHNFCIALCRKFYPLNRPTLNRQCILYCIAIFYVQTKLSFLVSLNN